MLNKTKQDNSNREWVSYAEAGGILHLLSTNGHQRVSASALNNMQPCFLVQVRSPRPEQAAESDFEGRPIACQCNGEGTAYLERIVAH